MNPDSRIISSFETRDKNLHVMGSLKGLDKRNNEHTFQNPSSQNKIYELQSDHHFPFVSSFIIKTLIS